MHDILFFALLLPQAISKGLYTDKRAFFVFLRGLQKFLRHGGILEVEDVLSNSGNVAAMPHIQSSIRKDSADAVFVRLIAS